MKYFGKKGHFIIAEIASSHDGKISKLKKLTDFSLNTGADAVKFQIFKASKLLSINNPLYKEFKKIEINFKEWKKFFLTYKKYKKKIIVEPFDFDSLEFCNSLNNFSAIKVPVSCLNDKNYLFLLKKINKPIILSIASTEIKEVQNIYKFFNQKNEIVLMYGIQNFPTKLSDLNLNKIIFLKEKFRCLIGYADHTDSNETFYSKYIPLLAHSLGANIIEKHITINRHLKGRDYYSALNPNEFKDFVDIFNFKKKIYGKKNWALNKADKKYAAFTKKYAVTNKLIKKDEKIKRSDIDFKRINTIGIDYKKINSILNKKAKKNFKADEIIKLKYLK